ncbi:programmed cell death protein 4 isoform X2 [Ostrinia furnacalis]|uniref:programmed cell death protein 4 isoform X1 n=1 Tax=Ostrinia furnacalis TaxID=93504 RepID=UPI00103DE6D1|nr:programmed cell death protein 4 isoform X1 [Ostrinia furnacalis]XP_028157160.1 programmed cell death protein 4 isoform X2 [Ostrinia furnacalis]
MEVDRADENVAVDENAKPVAADEGAAGDATTSNSERLKRKGKKYARSNSKDGGVASTTPLPKYRSWKNSRRPRNGHGRGLPKKGGAGGKGVWGAPGSEMLEELVEDANDPNYDSEAISNGDVEFKQVIVEADPEEVMHKSEPVILEYFEHGDTNAACEDFLEFVTAKRSHLVCEMIVEIALDHKPSHCEMASVLISDLYGRVFSAKDIGYAFERLLDKLPDLVLDTPDAAVLLSNFIARCVADDCLPPRFVQSLAAAELNTHARQAIHRAETLLSMNQGLVRLDNIWGVGGGIRPVKSLIRQIQLLLKEYLTSGELAEAVRCVRELEVPHFHHELVYETVLLAVESINSSVEEQLCTFLAELRRCVIVSPDQMDRGFLRVLEDMSDIVLDVPLAYIMLDRFMERCQRKFRLGDHVLKRAPTRGRKRFVSEGDGGAIKDHALKLRE